MKKNICRQTHVFLMETILVLLTVLWILLGATQVVQAAAVTSRVPIVCYTISTARIDTYYIRNNRYVYAGHIDGSTDKCTILEVRSDGYCKVQYPVSRGYKTAYAQSSAFFINTNFSTETKQIGQRKAAYRRSDLSQSIGTVYADDNVIVVGTSGNATQVIYPAGYGYKLGWISGTYGSSSSGETTANLSNGYYIIKSSKDENYVLDVYGGSEQNGANIQLYRRQNSINQGFIIKKENDGYYSVIAMHSNKYMDVANAGKANGTNVLQWISNGGDNQRWKIVKTSDGYYSFISKCNGLYLDISGGITANETNIQCYTGNGSAAQKFSLEEVTYNGKRYGESDNSKQSVSAFQMPLNGVYCSWRSSNNWSWAENANGGGYSSARVYHLGADLLGSSDDVYAIGDGAVVKSGWNNANGNYVVIRHQVSGKTVYSFYAHLSSRNVSAGIQVNKGDKIGVVGNTGSSSRGKHLHFAMMDTLWSGSYYGYSTYFTGNTRTYQGVTYYNPIYVVQNGKLP